MGRVVGWGFWGGEAGGAVFLGGERAGRGGGGGEGLGLAWGKGRGLLLYRVRCVRNTCDDDFFAIFLVC